MRKKTVIYDGISGGAYNGGRYLTNAIRSEGESVIVLPSEAGLGAGDLADALTFTVEGYDMNIGHYFHGRYTSGNGLVFDDGSLAVEIRGVSYGTLSDIAEKLCSMLKVGCALIKDAESSRVVLIET